MSQENTISRRSGYTAIPNSVVSDTSISIEARGLLALLMSFQEGWKFRSSHLMKVCCVGRDKFYRMTGELRAAGYLRFRQTRDEEGGFNGCVWEIIDEPESADGSPENPHPDFQESGKSGHIRIPTGKNNNDKNPPTPLSRKTENRPGSLEERRRRKALFDAFWASYPKCKRKTDRPKAAVTFERIILGKHPNIERTDAETIIAGVRKYAATNPDPEFIPLPTTWLNGARWESSGDSPSAKVLRYQALADGGR